MLNHSLLSFKQEKNQEMLKLYFMFSLQFLLKEVILSVMINFKFYEVFHMIKELFKGLDCESPNRLEQKSVKIKFPLEADWKKSILLSIKIYIILSEVGVSQYAEIS